MSPNVRIGRFNLGTLLFGVLILLALAACGVELETVAAEIENPDTTDPVGPEISTTTSEPESAVGAFTVSVSPSVTVGDSVALAAEVEAGGPLSARVTDGRCEISSDLVVAAVAIGRCEITVSQAKIEGYEPAAPQTVALRVVRAPNKPAGSFDIDGPEVVTVGDEFVVTVSVRRGGSVVVEPLTDSCEKAGIAAGSGDIEFTAVSVGECRLQLRQRMTDSYGASERAFVVEVEAKPNATVSIEAPSSVTAGSDFEVKVSAEGADGPAILTVSGNCGVSLPTAILSDFSDEVAIGSSTRIAAGREVGSCQLSATIEPATGFGPAKPASKKVEITKAQGSLDCSHPSEADVNETFLIKCEAIGGEATIEITDGACRGDYQLGLRFLVFGPSVGTCSFTVTQATTAEFEAADPYTFSVEISEPIVKEKYTIAVLAERRVMVGETFSVTLQVPDEVANLGEFEPILVSGPCERLGTEAYKAVELGECEFSVDGLINSETIQTVASPDTVRVDEFIIN